MKAFDSIRARDYNKLAWAQDKEYIQAILDSVSWNKNDSVLDVGTGTGILVKAVAPLVSQITGIDSSASMIKGSANKNGIWYVLGDIKDRIFSDNEFNKITARNVFHHILTDTQKAMDECYRILKPGGQMILAEGVPPSNDVHDEWAYMFSLKEKRIVFSPRDLLALMDKSQFKNIKIKIHFIKNFSVKNWLEYSGLTKTKQETILYLFRNYTQMFEYYSNMRITKDDILIDSKNIILVGEK